jgi:hypothetical protein
LRGNLAEQSVQLRLEVGNFCVLLLQDLDSLVPLGVQVLLQLLNLSVAVVVVEVLRLDSLIALNLHEFNSL